MSNDNGFTGVSNCYVFKSRLQEYAQKAGIPTPVYETVKEGPSHEPCFRSTVTVNNVRYESLPGFFNRKAAEQSAAEIAFMELHKSGNMTECIPHPVHETGLCKNLLQEYAQKMNYAIPAYICNRQAKPGKMPFSCTVEIGGIQYIGAAAKTKKEAEIKAARTALLAIQSNTCGSEVNPDGGPKLTVLPCKKRGRESETLSETAKTLKPKKANLKKKWTRRRFPRNKGDRLKISQNEQENANKEKPSGTQVGDSGMSEANMDSQENDYKDNQKEQENDYKENPARVKVEESGISEANMDSQDGHYVGSKFNPNEQGTANVDCIVNEEGTANVDYIPGINEQGTANVDYIPGVNVEDLRMLAMETNKDSQDGKLEFSSFDQNGSGICNVGYTSIVQNEDSILVTEANNVSQDVRAAIIATDFNLGATETHNVESKAPVINHGLIVLESGDSNLNSNQLDERTRKEEFEFKHEGGGWAQASLDGYEPVEFGCIKQEGEQAEVSENGYRSVEFGYIKQEEGKAQVSQDGYEPATFGNVKPVL
ncbi:uncharacterized protein LOC143849807 [Tasmannia lanceolata]|uniref:uncharacterized protein LOC143849807 n=1 Tax=Tasmannia lanceolata TaxID=3420 RepID=UPI00406364AA